MNTQDRYIHFDNWDVLDTASNTLTMPSGTVIEVWPIEKLSKKAQEGLNNFWAVVNGEKTYKEAFPEKE